MRSQPDPRSRQPEDQTRSPQISHRASSLKTECLGRLRLRRGRHTVRFTVVDKHVDSAGLRISPDLIALVAHQSP
ncbi:hypothetical protein [Phytoactinopolyspora endophytica]|uniref:hypothetical protein n=1 Tax=Phytoactinopolyspora endophytica TaxID=1642495 RepID=UPI00197B1628|nr:hypothetical protein [Phytoactinopolyspora endophytica]